MVCMASVCYEAADAEDQEKSEKCIYSDWAGLSSLMISEAEI